MYNLKKILFPNLTPRQKSALFSFLMGFVKKNFSLSKDEILNKFLEEECYYDKIGQTHFHFVIENIENDKFTEDILKFINGAIYHINHLEPLIDKRKEHERMQRIKTREYKMAREKPTQKQIKYYEKITKSRNLPTKNLEGASRLDLKNWIMEIVDE